MINQLGIRPGTRQALDRTVLVDLWQLPEGMLEPLAALRWQWCSEPSVHGGKGTAAPELSVATCNHNRSSLQPS